MLSAERLRHLLHKHRRHLTHLTFAVPMFRNGHPSMCWCFPRWKHCPLVHRPHTTRFPAFLFRATLHVCMTCRWLVFQTHCKSHSIGSICISDLSFIIPALNGIFQFLAVLPGLVLISQASVSMSLLSQLFASSLVLEFDIVVRSGQLLSAPSYSYWQSIWISTTSLINRRLIKRPLLVPLF